MSCFTSPLQNIQHFAHIYDSTSGNSTVVAALLEPLQTELLKRDGCAPPSSSSSSSCSAEAKPRRGRLTVIPHCFAERILQENGSAVGVAGVVSEFDEEDTGPFRKPPLRNVKLVVSEGMNYGRMNMI